VKYYVFVRILALCRAQVKITIPTIHMGVIECKLPMCMVEIVITPARHSAKIRAKSLIVLKNWCNHRAPMQWNGSFTVLLYCLLVHCKHLTTWIAVERKQSLAHLLLVWMNRTAVNNACSPNRITDHRVTYLVALLAVRTSHWCGLASMYSMLLL
jgi:hypothetical protein